MDPDQTALGSHCLSMRFQIISWVTKIIHFVIMPLRVYKCELSVYKVRIFMKCTHVCAAQKPYQLFTKL